MKNNSLSVNPLALAVRNTLAGTGAVMALGTGGLVMANEVRGLGEINLTNNADPGFSEIRGIDSLSFRVPAGETEITVGGYVKLDTIFDSASDLGDSFIVSSIPADGTALADQDGHFRIHARQSRLRVRSETKGLPKALITHIEGDFFGNDVGQNETFSNSNGFRLRQAYATYGPWTIGQAFTNFMDFVAYPTTVDFFGPAGKSFVRQAQIRYTMDNGLSFSIENPETDGEGALGRIRESTGGPGQDIAPDITAAWRGGPGGAGGEYEIGTVVRFLGVDGDLDGTRIDEDETGYGINLAGGWQLGKFYLAGSITGGDGIGRYIINGFGNDVFVTDTGELETVESLSGTVSLKYDWTPKTNSLLALGGFSNDTPEESNGIDNLQTIHLNYIWTPFERASFGVEIIQGFIEFADGSDGDATRYQFGAQYNF